MMLLTEAINEQCVLVSKIQAQVWHICVCNLREHNVYFLNAQSASLPCSSSERGRSCLCAGSIAVYESNLQERRNSVLTTRVAVNV
jgi:hypothetical protein